MLCICQIKIIYGDLYNTYAALKGGSKCFDCVMKCPQRDSVGKETRQLKTENFSLLKLMDPFGIFYDDVTIILSIIKNPKVRTAVSSDAVHKLHKLPEE
jgi:hypothetical protein